MMENAMLAQVRSLPGLIGQVLPVLDHDAREVFDQELGLTAGRLFVTGCGDSFHAALATELAFEEIAAIPTEPVPALKMSRYQADFLPDNRPGHNIVIAISVSGEVARTLEALLRARRAGAITVGLTATPGSRLAEAGNRTLIMKTPPFEFSPGVRTYMATLLMLYCSAIRLGEARGKLSAYRANEARRELALLPEAVQCTIDNCDGLARQTAEAWKDANEFVFAGDGPNYGTALYSAAKILEACGDSATGQDMEEWAHLQYFARTANTPTFFISAAQRGASRAAEVAAAARAIGRRVAAVVPEGETAIAGEAEAVFRFPKTEERLSPFLACLPGMLFAAHRSEIIGESYFRDFGGGRSAAGGGGISRIRTSEIIE